MEVDADVARIFEEHKKLLSKAVDDCMLALKKQVVESMERAHTASNESEGTSLDFVKPNEQLQNEIGLVEPNQDPSVELARHEDLYPPDEDEQNIEASEINGKTSDDIKDGTKAPSFLTRAITDIEEAAFGNVNPDKQLLLDLLIGFVIIMNTVTLLMELEYMGLAVARTFNSENTLQDVYESEQFRRDVFSSIETAFAAVYLLELIVRLAVLKTGYFKSVFNLFDTLLVIVTVASVVGEWAMTNGIFNMSYIRLIRMARLARSLRLLRTMRLFAGLRIMIVAMSKVLPKLCMMLSVLIAFILVGALVAGNLLSAFIIDEAQDLEDREWVWENYGTAYWACTTMFEIVFSGGWPTKVRPVLQKVSKWYLLLFLPYIIIVQFAAVRITTAVILKETFDLAYQDSSVVHDQTFKLHQKQLHTLKKVFETADKSDDGKISRDELLCALDDPDVKAALESLNFLPSEKTSLFDLLDDGDGKIGLDEFLAAISRLKGTAREADIILIERELHKINKLLHDTFSRPMSSTRFRQSPEAGILSVTV